MDTHSAIFLYVRWFVRFISEGDIYVFERMRKTALEKKKQYNATREAE